MILSQQTTSSLDTTREAGPDGHAQGVVAVQDTTRPGLGDPTKERHGRNGPAPETIHLPGPAYRPLAYPAWPTSQPGPQVTSPLPGQHPHPRRTDQMVYFSYDQERGIPCVSPPRSVAVQKPRGRIYLPDESVQEAASLGEALERWLDDGGTASLHAADVLKA